jgi:CRP/FNR family transcriptional regulator
MIASWLRCFPGLDRISDPFWNEAKTGAELAKVFQGEYLFRDGDPCAHYVLTLKGCIRVSRTADTGREIVVYRISEGQSCPLTTAVLFTGQRYPADAIADIDSYVVLFSAKKFQRAFEHSPGFRHFVCAGYGGRLHELIVLLEHVAFGNVNKRLAQWLLAHRGDATTPIDVSHSELAREVGSVREVVSRQLKSFERHGWIRLGRRRIEVTDQTGLAQMAPSGESVAKGSIEIVKPNIEPKHAHDMPMNIASVR